MDGTTLLLLLIHLASATSTGLKNHLEARKDGSWGSPKDGSRLVVIYVVSR